MGTTAYLRKCGVVCVCVRERERESRVYSDFGFSSRQGGCSVFKGLDCNFQLLKLQNVNIVFGLSYIYVCI